MYAHLHIYNNLNIEEKFAKILQFYYYYMQLLLGRAEVGSFINCVGLNVQCSSAVLRATRATFRFGHAAPISTQRSCISGNNIWSCYMASMQSSPFSYILNFI